MHAKEEVELFLLARGRNDREGRGRVRRRQRSPGRRCERFPGRRCERFPGRGRQRFPSRGRVRTGGAAAARHARCGWRPGMRDARRFCIPGASEPGLPTAARRQGVRDTRPSCIPGASESRTPVSAVPGPPVPASPGRGRVRTGGGAAARHARCGWRRCLIARIPPLAMHNGPLRAIPLPAVRGCQPCTAIPLSAVYDCQLCTI